MASGFRNSSGVDFDDLFEAGSVAAPGFRRANGTGLAYAARGSIPKGANVGFRSSSGVDLSDLWLPKGSGPPVPGFDGQTYYGETEALSGSTGTVSGTARLTMYADGTWKAERVAVNGSLPGTSVLDSGTWLPAGGSAADYTVQYAVVGSSGAGTVVNDATSPVSLASARTISLQASTSATGFGTVSGSRTVTATLVRVGAAGVGATFVLVASATGQA